MRTCSTKSPATTKGVRSRIRSSCELSPVRPAVATRAAAGRDHRGRQNSPSLDLRYNARATSTLPFAHQGELRSVPDRRLRRLSDRQPYLLNRGRICCSRTDRLPGDGAESLPAIPFEQLIIFSRTSIRGTCRRSLYCVASSIKSRSDHRTAACSPKSLKLCCAQRSIEFNPKCLTYLYETFYDKGKLARSSDPRDLLEIVRSICRFRRQDIVITEDLIAEAAHWFFVEM